METRSNATDRSSRHRLSVPSRSRQIEVEQEIEETDPSDLSALAPLLRELAANYSEREFLTLNEPALGHEEGGELPSLAVKEEFESDIPLKDVRLPSLQSIREEVDTTAISGAGVESLTRSPVSGASSALDSDAGPSHPGRGPAVSSAGGRGGAIEAEDANRRGLALQAAGHSADALREFDLAVELNPMQPEYHQNRALAAQAAVAEAEDKSRARIELTRSNPDTLAQLAAAA